MSKRIMEMNKKKRGMVMGEEEQNIVEKKKPSRFRVSRVRRLRVFLLNRRIGVLLVVTRVAE